MESEPSQETAIHDESKDKVVKEEKLDTEDAFAYLDRDNFTSEKFKIEIRNLPKYYGMPELRKFLNKKLNLDASKVKRPHNGSPWVYVCFRSEENRQAAIKAINGYNWKGKELKAETAKAVADPLVLKRQNRNVGDAGGKRQRIAPTGDLLEQLKNATTPLWKKPYDEQLELKTNNIRKVLRQLSADLESANPSLKSWLENQRQKFNGLPCELLPIRPSPVVDGYRNKCEFTIGINEVTGKKTVGMRLSSYAAGSLCVVSCGELNHLPSVMKTAAETVEKFISESPLDVYNQETHSGHWRSLTVRYGFRTKELMLMLIMHPQTLDETELTNVENRLREFFTNGEGAELKVCSLLLAMSGRGRERPQVRCVMGDPFIHEQVCGHTFRLSPFAFFQINTEAAEVLFDSIAELSEISEKSTLIDVCCGAGTIAICLSKRCGDVLGLEISAEAVEDAKRNAEENGLKNAQFFAGKAEDILSSVIHRATNSNIVAVVDPPRAGLERNAVSQLRKTKNLQQFVYASCHPQLALKNFVDFGRTPSKQYPNDPFVPIRCVPVDLFPHTEGCELVIFFQRWCPDDSQNESQD